MVETEPQLDISSHQMKLLVTGTGYIQFSCWSKGSHQNPQTIQDIAKAIGGSQQTDSEALGLKTIPT